MAATGCLWPRRGEDAWRGAARGAVTSVPRGLACAAEAARALGYAVAVGRTDGDSAGSSLARTASFTARRGTGTRAGQGTVEELEVRLERLAPRDAGDRSAELRVRPRRWEQLDDWSRNPRGATQVRDRGRATRQELDPGPTADDAAAVVEQCAR